MSLWGGGGETNATQTAFGTGLFPSLLCSHPSSRALAPSNPDGIHPHPNLSARPEGLLRPSSLSPRAGPVPAQRPPDLTPDLNVQLRTSGSQRPKPEAHLDAVSCTLVPRPPALERAERGSDPDLSLKHGGAGVCHSPS